jgi:PHP family Zn ribbon phosphoesterase
MRNYNIDIHIHSRFAYRTSKAITFEGILFEAKQKGIHVIGTGDILHQEWFKEVEPYFERVNKTILLTTEISVKGIHFLLIFPSVESVIYTQNEFNLKSKDINKNGRPNINIDYDELCTFCRSNNILFGLAHAFQQKGYIHRYKVARDVDFIEVGISFDPEWMNRLNLPYPFIKSSDAHSLPNIAREYCTFKMETMSFNNFKNALFEKKYSFTSTIYNVSMKYPIIKDTVIPFLDTKQLRNVDYRIRVPLLLAICLYYKLNKYSKKLNILYREMLERYKGDELYIKPEVPFKLALEVKNLDISETTKTYEGKIEYKG